MNDGARIGRESGAFNLSFITDKAVPIHGGCTWIRTRKPEATALQAAELAILFNTSEVVAIAGFEPAISGL